MALEKRKDQKSLRPFFGFYGGKWRDSPKQYPTPGYDLIVEPFAGSAGYSVRNAHKDVILCDLDPIVVGVWDFLISASPKEILSLPDLTEGQSVDDLPICQEARWLIGFWLNRGVARPRKTPSKWMREEVRPGSFWGDRVRRRLASQVNEIKHWRVIHCSYVDCPVSARATWFIDPPYQTAGKHYAFGSEGIDYSRLAKWCRSRPGQVIVCENQGAEWLTFERLPKHSTKTTRAGRRSKEVVWLKNAASAS